MPRRVRAVDAGKRGPKQFIVGGHKWSYARLVNKELAKYGHRYKPLSLNLARTEH